MDIFDKHQIEKIIGNIELPESLTEEQGIGFLLGLQEARASLLEVINDELKVMEDAIDWKLDGYCLL